MSDYGWLVIGMSNDEVKAMVEDFKVKRCHKQRMVFIIMGAVNGLAC